MRRMDAAIQSTIPYSGVPHVVEARNSHDNACSTVRKLTLSCAPGFVGRANRQCRLPNRRAAPRTTLVPALADIGEVR